MRRTTKSRPVIDRLAYSTAPPRLMEAFAEWQEAVDVEAKARHDLNMAREEVKQAPALDFARAREADKAGKPMPEPTEQKRKTAEAKAKIRVELRQEDVRQAKAKAEQAAKEHRPEWLENLGAALDTSAEVAAKSVEEARLAAQEQAALAAVYGALRIAPMTGKALPDKAPVLDVEGLNTLEKALSDITRTAIDDRVNKWHEEPPRQVPAISYQLIGN